MNFKSLELLPDFQHQHGWKYIQDKQVNSVKEEDDVVSSLRDVILKEVEKPDLKDGEYELQDFQLKCQLEKLCLLQPDKSIEILGANTLIQKVLCLIPVKPIACSPFLFVL